MKKIILASCLVLLAIFLTFSFGFAKVEAAPADCSSEGSGNWSEIGWDFWGTGTCVGGPNSSRTVEITDGTVVVVDENASAKNITINSGGAMPTGITISGTNSLFVTEDVSLTAPAFGQNATLAIGDGTLEVGTNLSISGGGSRTAEVSLNAGTLGVNGNIIFLNDALKSKLTSTGASSIYVRGDFGVGGIGMGTFDGTGSTLYLDGSAGSQTIGASTGYNNVTITNSSGSSVSLSAGTTNINGDLDITVTGGSTVLDVASSVLTVGGVTTIDGEGATFFISNATGLKTFTGDVDLINGGSFAITQDAVIEFKGSLSLDGSSSFMASGEVGNLIFTGTNKTINGPENRMNVYDLTINGTVSNDGWIIVQGDLDGTGTLTNSATGNMRVSGTVTVSLDASTTGNTFAYAQNVGTQTVLTSTDYYNLNLTGGSVKQIGAAINVTGNLYLDSMSGTVVDLTGESTVANLVLDGEAQLPGTYGATGSGAENINDTFFSGTGTILVPDSFSPTFTAVRTGLNTFELTFNEPINASADIDAWTIYTAGGNVPVVSSSVVSGTTMTLISFGLTDTGYTPSFFDDHYINYVQANGDVQDEATIPNLLADGGNVIPVDQVPPMVTVTMDDYDLTRGETALVTFTFSEYVTEFSSADVTVENGTLSETTPLEMPNVFSSATAVFTPTAGISDATNIITTGTGYTDFFPSVPNTATTSATSENYTVNTVATSSGGRVTGGYATGTRIGNTFTLTTVTSTSTPKFTFTKNLKFLTLDNEVKELQKFLNTHGYPVSLSGAGSNGLETTKFGLLTQKALIKFQKANNITPALGYFGPITRALVNSLLK